MKRFGRYGWLFGLALCGAVGCQKGDGAGAPTRTDGPYAGDIEKLCNVVVRSGGDKEVGADRNFLIATWLGANLETPESRKFLARIQPLVGEQKATAIEAEAKRVGLTGCPLADEWRKPPLP
ncbi:MAG: mucin-associated surface protein [Deltaproteobacteria bacterium]|nr:mucin-associated surface protein [Deltaproteobacteria bacterium]